ncbi:MAG: hypothetical protein WC401_07285 [Bacteroidales bacterium]
MKTNYQVTFGYKAIITIGVKAENEEQAKKEATEILKSNRDKMFKANNIDLQDDTFKPDGILNMDETWNQF